MKLSWNGAQSSHPLSRAARPRRSSRWSLVRTARHPRAPCNCRKGELGHFHPEWAQDWSQCTSSSVLPSLTLPLKLLIVCASWFILCKCEFSLALFWILGSEELKGRLVSTASKRKKTFCIWAEVSTKDQFLKFHLWNAFSEICVDLHVWGKRREGVFLLWTIWVFGLG